MYFYRLFFLYFLFAVGAVTAQLGLGGLYGNPYAMGSPFGIGGYPGGLGMGMGYGMMSPYGYGSYDIRCRNLLNGYGYNPMFGGMLGKK